MVVKIGTIPSVFIYAAVSPFANSPVHFDSFATTWLFPSPTRLVVCHTKMRHICCASAQMHTHAVPNVIENLRPV